MILYLKALHIIFVVTWFAGLFYIPRLFIYHVEAQKKDEPEKSILSTQFKIMAKRLWYGITWPSAILTYIFGFWLSYETFILTSGKAWFLLKLAFVFGLTLYHLQCGIIYNQLQKKIFKWSALKLRFWNEVATLFLFAIVFTVVLKEQGNFWWGIIGLLIFSGLLTFAIFIYKKRRAREVE